ncbi:hypothetical protein [Chryseobacterium wangxinyae]|uniref:hypothetical protein n=1 Tax=Chryseobacterium sp. CY353 TaxID=2997334 RepID=UPI00226E3740|nr:hypothetical protein [Chryseobacterium sp. CY353]MCY0968760.1 hypothetical protein [Chryseobacterium sp. CY353]
MKKISFLMLLALAFLLSCRTDQFPEKETYNNTSAFQLTSKRISLDESKHKTKLLPELKKAELGIKAFKSNAQGKLVNYADGVSIDTDNVIYIENGPNYYTYTFRINRENAPADAPVENLVLSPLSDGTYREMLVTYDLTSQEKNTILSGDGVDLSGKIGYTPLQSGTYSTGLMQKTNDNCYWVVDYTFTTCSEGVHNHGEMADENGGTCQAEVQSVIVVNSAEYVCPNPGGSDPGTIYNPGNTTYPGNNTNPSTEPGAPTGGSPSGSTGTPNPCGGNGISSQPQDPSSTLGNQPCNNGTPTLPNLSTEHFKFNQIISQLSPALQSWINQPYNAEVYTYFINYFTYNNQSLEAGNFVKWSINFLYQNQDVTLAQFQPMLTFLHNFLQENTNVSSYFSQHPEDLEKILFKGLNYNNISDVTFANKFALAFTEILIAEKNNTVNQVNVQDPTWSLAKEYMIYLIKQNAASAVKYGRVIYEHASHYFSQHPNSLQKVNSFLEYLKVGVELEIPIEKNHQYMKWTDVLLCWLFELGDFPMNDSAGYGNLPTIGFSGLDYTISGITTPYIIPMRYLSAHKIKNGVPDVNSVLDVKRIAINNIKNGNLSPINREWVFGSDATVETITKLDGMQFCLGSYRTDVYITTLGNNQYKLTYIIKNKTGWQSGTRGLNDYNGNPTDDSIIPDKPRGMGVHLGGTIGETYGWYEIITVT